MSKINTKTSVHLMQMNDRGMRKFGVKELLKNYDENIIDMIEKATTAPFNSLPEIMEALEAYKAVYPEVDQIMQGIQEVVKKKRRMKLKAIINFLLRKSWIFIIPETTS